MTARRALVLLGLLCSLPVLAACGSSHPSGAAHSTTVPTTAGEATVRTANCHLWRVLAPADRQQLVVGLRAFFAGRVDAPGKRGQVLADKYANKLLTSYCRQRYAGAFMLYRLYGNAAAFTAGG